MKIIDVVVLGAGPAGITCGIESKNNQLSTLMVDRGNVVNSMIHFPAHMTFFSTPDLLQLGGMPFTSASAKPTRVEAIKYYQSLISFFKIPVKTNTTIKKITKTENFQIHYSTQGSEEMASARYIILATGFYDNPNFLNVPGEDLKHVSHYYNEPYAYYNQDVVVVGGKNSAVITALELHRHGARVTLVHRKSTIGESIKYWILPDIQNRISEGAIHAFFNSTVQKITEKSVMINRNGESITIAADAVFLLTGYHPDVQILNMCNISYNPESLEPVINKNNLESNISGIYLAGSIIAGRNANKIFIENSREHGVKIISDIVKKIHATKQE